MPEHRLIVAQGFRVAGWVIGLPSALAAIGLGVGAAVLGARPAAPSQMLNVGDYGLVGLLSNAATGLVGVLSFLGGVAAWVMGVLAVAALLAALFAALLYAVGRGLRVSAGWARVVGIALTTVLMLNGLFALLMLQDAARLAVVVILAALAYALWTLGWRFRTPG